ncbi:MAG: hypothetical protein WBD50_05565 [Candidatus Rhabdochlamydia sp.]
MPASIDSNYITVSLPNKTSLKNAFLDNKTICIITGLALIALGISIGAPIGALIYNEMTGARFASCYP